MGIGHIGFLCPIVGAPGDVWRVTPKWPQHNYARYLVKNGGLG